MYILQKNKDKQLNIRIPLELYQWLNETVILIAKVHSKKLSKEMIIKVCIEFLRNQNLDWQNISRLENAEIRYKDAALRHLTETGIVEDMIPYGEMTHEGAVIWNFLADLEIKLRNDKYFRNLPN